jgi:DNA-directed RNA polymerase alpha subunit
MMDDNYYPAAECRHGWDIAIAEYYDAELDCFRSWEAAIEAMRLQQVDERLRIAIADWRQVELSTRAVNCLTNVGIATLGDLIQWSEAELLRVNNLGRRTLIEIKLVLSEFGLALASARAGDIEPGRVCSGPG